MAVDGSAPSMRAARLAISLARATGASLGAVVAVETPIALGASGSLDVQVKKHLLLRAKDALKEVARMAKPEDVEVRPSVLEGHVPTAIARHAEEEGADLLVVGSRGLSGAGRLFLGSVSTALVYRARVSVLVVR